MTGDYLKYDLPRRRRYQAQGLNVWGRPLRRRRELPELENLSGKERHRVYMQLWRAKKVSTKI